MRVCSAVITLVIVWAAALIRPSLGNRKRSDLLRSSTGVVLIPGSPPHDLMRVTSRLLRFVVASAAALSITAGAGACASALTGEQPAAAAVVAPVKIMP